MKPTSYKLSIRLSVPEYEALKFVASQSQKSLSAVAREKLFTTLSLAELDSLKSNWRQQQRQLKILVEWVEDFILTEDIVASQTIKNIRPFIKHIQQQWREDYDK
jgi:hypothetical protein